MKIPEGTLFMLAGEGRLTLQVPDGWIGEPAPQMVEVPDDWVQEVKIVGHRNGVEVDRPVVGKESGFLHLTKKGYLANKAAIIDAYVKGPFRGGEHGVTPAERAAAFEKFATIYFQNMADNVKKRRADLAKQIQQLKAIEESLA